LIILKVAFLAVMFEIRVFFGYMLVWPLVVVVRIPVEVRARVLQLGAAVSAVVRALLIL
jgi:hypothetical protein